MICKNEDSKKLTKLVLKVYENRTREAELGQSEIKQALRNEGYSILAEGNTYNFIFYSSTKDFEFIEFADSKTDDAYIVVYWNTGLDVRANYTKPVVYKESPLSLMEKVGKIDWDV